ncbi:hypothetical protein SprV_0802620000 [Sparganum proliferum]
MSCDHPSEGEVVDAIRKLRNNKTSGEDGIPAEIYESCVDTLVPWLHGVTERAWIDEVVPDDWGIGILVPILKKGDKTRCENNHGISITDVATKIYAIGLLRRFQAVRDSKARPNQAGVRAGRRCADQIFTLRCILELRLIYQQPTVVCFLDFAAALDSVHHESLWRIMALDGLPAKIIPMIKAYYRTTVSRVLVRNNLSQPFGIRSINGLSINAGKTKVFSSCIPDQEKAPLEIDGCQLEEVDSFKYLGTRQRPNGQSKDDIVSRIVVARWVFSSLRKCL